MRGSASWRADGETPLADPAERNPRVWIQAVKWF
jgi:hypothetical protein